MATKKRSSAKKPAKKKPSANKARPKKAQKKKTPKKKAAPKKTQSKKAQAKKAQPKKAQAKKEQPKKATPKKAQAKKVPAKVAAADERKPFKRRDATGHLDPDYARDLRRSSVENQEHDDDRGFLAGDRANDALANELGREFVETVTSGEDSGNELRDELVTEEMGGPFVPSTAEKEVADDTDESNPLDATREPFPKV